MIFNIETMSDQQLSAVNTAFTILCMMEDAGVRPALSALDVMPDDEQDSISVRVNDEIARRTKIQTDATVAHVIEQEDAAEEDNRPRDRNRVMAHRAARLLKLISLNAPEVIVDTALDVLART